MTTFTGHDTLKTRRTLEVGGKSYDYFSLKAAEQAGLGDVSTLPFSLKVLLENLLRFEDGRTVSVDDVKALGQWLKDRRSDTEIAYRPARVLMQDFTGVPAVADLAAMREAVKSLGGEVSKINPLCAVDLVIDHSVMVDEYGNCRRLQEERRSGVRAQSGALRLPALGPDRVRQLPRRSARHRHLPSGQRRISGPDRLDRHRSGDRQDHRLSRHPRRHRQPHHHGQRLGRAGLGRRRHRGRGGHAGPADLHADPGSRRLQAGRQAEGRRHRDRPRADRHPDAAQARRGRQVRRVLRPRPRGPAAGRPRDDRQHGPGIRRHLRHLPDRRRDHQVPDLHRPRSRAGGAGRSLRQGAGHVGRAGLARAGLHRRAGTGPLDRRTRSCRPEAPAGQGPAVGSVAGIHQRPDLRVQGSGRRREQGRAGQGQPTTA